MAVGDADNGHLPATEDKAKAARRESATEGTTDVEAGDFHFAKDYVEQIHHETHLNRKKGAILVGGLLALLLLIMILVLALGDEEKDDSDDF